MPPPPIIDTSQFDYDHPIFLLDDIRRINPQRHEMEQLTAIVHADKGTGTIVGYKDVAEDEFWTRGHMPGFPLMPGVILCEAAAQLAGFYARYFEILDGDYLGFGGMNNVRFRSPVYPKSRLIIIAHLTKLRPNRRAEFDFQGFVEGKMTFSGEMIGVPIFKNPKAAIG